MQELNYIRCDDSIFAYRRKTDLLVAERIHRDYLKEHHFIRFNALCLSGKLWTYLADLNEQAQNRLLVSEQF